MGTKHLKLPVKDFVHTGTRGISSPSPVISFTSHSARTLTPSPLMYHSLPSFPHVYPWMKGSKFLLCSSNENFAPPPPEELHGLASIDCPDNVAQDSILNLHPEAAASSFGFGFGTLGFILIPGYRSAWSALEEPFPTSLAVDDGLANHVALDTTT